MSLARTACRSRCLGNMKYCHQRQTLNKAPRRKLVSINHKIRKMIGETVPKTIVNPVLARMNVRLSVLQKPCEGHVDVIHTSHRCPKPLCWWRGPTQPRAIQARNARQHWRAGAQRTRQCVWPEAPRNVRRLAVPMPK